MSLRVIGSHTMRIATTSFLTLLLIAFSLIQIKQYLIRRDSMRLLADFHSISLNETSWPEAQALMQRWGKLGHAHGPCSSTDCAYDITLIGWPSLLPNGNGTATRWLYRFGRFPLLLQRVGMRFSIMELRFLIEDGTVRRAHLSITAETENEKYMSALLVTVRSRTSLDDSDEALHTVGADEELGTHPDFIVGPDGFCTGCENISLVYTPHIAPNELVRLTSFNISCLTRMRPCPHLSELAPALMREDATNLRSVPRNSVPCTTPAWALARDAGAIWLVDTIARAQVPDPKPPYGETPPLVEEDQVRLVRILKGPLRIPPETHIRFRPYSGVEYQARAVPEHLIQGHRYLLLPSPDEDWLKEGAEAWRCGVLEDSPANQLAMKQGIAMDDRLRLPELTGVWPW
jgi:hypothetical protein